jgi:uncharacterized protein
MKHILIFLSVFVSYFGLSQIPDRPEPPRLYNNLSKEFPNFLNDNEATALEEKLEQFSNETSNQIAVVIVDDLNGYDAADFTIKLANKWEVGKKDKNNGIVIMIKPTGKEGGRDLFIAVGYGLEGAIPDLATKRIREENIYPHLKNGDNYKALDEGTDILMKLAKGEIDVKDYTRRSNRSERFPLIAIIIIVIIIIIIKNIFNGGGGGHTISRAGRAIFWGSMLGGGRGGGWSGGGGSSGGGGWGGFGGGGFGGGGSGGKW